MPICSVAELFGVTPANTHDVNDTGRVIVTVALLSAARLNVPHCLKRNQDPSDDSLRSTSISLPNFVIRGYANGCVCAF